MHSSVHCRIVVGNHLCLIAPHPSLSRCRIDVGPFTGHPVPFPRSTPELRHPFVPHPSLTQALAHELQLDSPMKPKTARSTIVRVRTRGPISVEISMSTPPWLKPEARRTLALALLKEMDRKIAYPIEQIEVRHLDRPPRIPCVLEQSDSIRDAIDLNSAPNQKIWGFRLRLLRQKAGWTQKMLSLASGVNRAHISDLERGKHFPNPDVVERLDRSLRTRQKAIDSSLRPEPVPTSDTCPTAVTSDTNPTP